MLLLQLLLALHTRFQLWIVQHISVFLKRMWPILLVAVEVPTSEAIVWVFEFMLIISYVISLLVMRSHEADLFLVIDCQRMLAVYWKKA